MKDIFIGGGAGRSRTDLHGFAIGGGDGAQGASPGIKPRATRLERAKRVLLGKIPPICGVLLLLTACGGGGDEARCITATDKMQLFGDSTQLLAQPYWEARWPGRIINSAVGETNSRQLLAGTDGLNAPWPKSVRGSVVVIKHGTNDGTTAYGLTPLETYKANLRAFASVPQFVIFETPDPSTDPERSTSVPPYTQAMREVAAEMKVPIIDTDACWRAHQGWEAFLSDGTHATPDGLQFTVSRCVAPVIQALSCR